MNFISAKVIADSVNIHGDRLTTIECEYPRFIHGEILTHRMFSRNAQSSRAVPVTSTINANKIFVKPYVWGKNRAGMSSEEVLTGFKKNLASLVWNTTARMCFTSSLLLSKIGLHKQWSNRLTEWCSTIKVVITATEWENFFWLRLDEGAAQPEIVELAHAILGAMNDSTPYLVGVGQYHIPYVKAVRWDGKDLYYDSNDNLLTLEEAKQISASCCAQVSYRKLNDSKDKAIEIYERLFSGSKPHLSPVEHQGTPIPVDKYYNLGEDKGVTHMDNKGDFWSANFKGWIQLRQSMAQDK